MSGKLRITRNNSLATMYKWNGSSWDNLASGNAGTSDMYIRLGASSWANNPSLTIDFDNLAINYDSIDNLQVIPEPLSLFLCMMAFLVLPLYFNR